VFKSKLPAETTKFGMYKQLEHCFADLHTAAPADGGGFFVQELPAMPEEVDASKLQVLVTHESGRAFFREHDRTTADRLGACPAGGLVIGGRVIDGDVQPGAPPLLPAHPPDCNLRGLVW
jgi:hypothetical protein